MANNLRPSQSHNQAEHPQRHTNNINIISNNSPQHPYDPSSLTYNHANRYPNAFITNGHNINNSNINYLMNSNSNNNNNNNSNINFNSTTQLTQAPIQQLNQTSYQSSQNRLSNPNGSYSPTFPHPSYQQHQQQPGQQPPPSYSYPPQSSSMTSATSANGTHDTEEEEDEEEEEEEKEEPLGLKARLKKWFFFPCTLSGKLMISIIGIEALLVIIIQVIIAVLYFQSLVSKALPPAESGPNAGVSVPPYQDWRNQSRSIPAYMIVFIFAQLFQLVFAWDAVRAQNTIELIGIVIFNLCCFAYSIFEISQTKNSLHMAAKEGFFVPEEKAMELQSKINPGLIVAICVIGLTQILITWLAYRLFKEFGWTIYKKIGADPTIR
ncbi:hypothetical protein BX616_004614, partial [Lobosporangium transversale]